MRLVLAWAVTIWLCTIAAGQPVARITAPAEAQPGNLVLLKTTGTVGTGLVWLVLPTEAEPFFFDAQDRSGEPVGIFACSQPGTYQFVLACTQDGQVALAVHTLRQGTGPVPPPTPPPPQPGIAPIPVAGLHVLIIEETADRPKLADSQLVLVQGTAIREYVTEHGGEFRQFDDDLPLSRAPEVWRNAMALPRDTLPWFIVSQYPRGGYSGPLPQTIEEALVVLKEWAE